MPRPIPLLIPLLLASLLAGCGTPSLLITPVSRTDALEETEVARGKANAKIVVIPVEGLLANARAPGLIQEGDNKLSVLTQQLDRAARDKSVRAVVLRINSPGGTVTGSDNMYELVRRFRAASGKPVVASVQEIGASGGYYVALAADRIVANPTSVVGSIGVIFNAFSVEGGLSRLGIKSESIKSGPLKDIGSPFRDLTADERAVLQATVDEYFARFKGLVAERRKLDDAALARVTDGRVFSGAGAMKLGLVDQVGILEDAIDLARTLGDAPGGRAVMYRKPFGPGGSVYAAADAPVPQAQPTLQLPIPTTELSLPTGFYYLWRP